MPGFAPGETCQEPGFYWRYDANGVQEDRPVVVNETFPPTDEEGGYYEPALTVDEYLEAVDALNEVKLSLRKFAKAVGAHAE